MLACFKGNFMAKILTFVGIFFVLIVIAVAGRLGEEFGDRAFAPESPSKEDLERGLIRGFNEAVETINQDLPAMIDDEIRMDKATVGPGAMMTYHYTFLNHVSNEVDSQWIRSGVRENVANNVCKSQEMKRALQYGAAYRYSYSGSDQKFIAGFQITREDCGYADARP